jgi:integrase
MVINDEWREAVARWDEWHLAGGGSSETLRLRHHYIGHLSADHPEPWTVTTDDLIHFLARRGWAPETRKSARSTVRSFYGWAQRVGIIEHSPAAALPSVRVPAGCPRPTPEQHVSEALDRASQRDRLMVLLAAYAGLRRAEIAAIHRRSVRDDELVVKGKGARWRVIPLHPRLTIALAAWPLDGYLFPGMIDGHISPGQVGRILSRLLGPGWTGHTLRHRFLSAAYAAERDIRAVQALAGHAKIDTTVRYTAVPAGALLRAVHAVA